jgi:hypothetical protein
MICGSGLNWLRTASSGRLLLTQYCTFSFYERQGKIITVGTTAHVDKTCNGDLASLYDGGLNNELPTIEISYNFLCMLFNSVL